MADVAQDGIGDMDEILSEVGGPQAVEGSEQDDPVIEEIFGGGEAAEEVVEAQADAEGEPEEQVEEVEAAEENPDPQQDVAPKGRAEKRIQGLVSQVKNMETQLQTQQAAMLQQFQQQQQQQNAYYQAQLQEQQRQAEIASRQLELLQSRQEAEQDATLTPMERYKKQVVAEAMGLAKQQFSSELEPLRAQLEQEKAAREQAARQYQAQARLQKYSALTSQATEQVVLKSVSEQARSQMGKPMADMLLSFCAATGLAPEVAAPQFANMLDSYHKARLAATVPAGQKIKAGQKVPAPASGGRRVAQGDARPAWNDLRAAGFDNYIEWRAKGAPAIAKSGKK